VVFKLLIITPRRSQYILTDEETDVNLFIFIVTVTYTVGRFAVVGLLIVDTLPAYRELWHHHPSPAQAPNHYQTSEHIACLARSQGIDGVVFLLGVTRQAAHPAHPPWPT
jgi:hypothetical protein